MKINFQGAARTVTGSKHLITLESGKKILLDCGMFQGRQVEADELNKFFLFNPEELDAVILSHAHIDHSGLLPKLVKDGFKGPIYSTFATKDLCEIMLTDSAHIQETEAYYTNKYRSKTGKPFVTPLYNSTDAVFCMNQFMPVQYRTSFKVCDEVAVEFFDAGHILGSAIVYLTITENNKTTTLTYSGDVGRYVNRILRFPDEIPQSDYIILESTYGNREHGSAKDAAAALLETINEVCIDRRGKLIIPAFSIGKTQELIYTLNKMKNKDVLPNIKVFVDSPLAINATDIFRNHTYCFSDSILKFMENDPDPFGFNHLHYIQKQEQSKALNMIDEPCIIISASGMADAGRVKHHLANTIENPNNGILFIGFCEGSSLGGRIIAGAEKVTIYDQEYKVKAKVKVIDFFSAHADRNELIRFLSCQDPKLVKQVFLVHGNENALLEFQKTLRQKDFAEVVVADYNKSYELD
jgi:metallo-beta-lactamase family protein